MCAHVLCQEPLLCVDGGGGGVMATPTTTMRERSTHPPLSHHPSIFAFRPGIALREHFFANASAHPRGCVGMVVTA